jgi:DNA-binding transcriptional MerR regulator
VYRSKQRSESKSDTGGGINLTELAAQSGVPERTIRYYIARGIVPGPVRGGRGAEYTKEHLAGIHEVRRMQARGLTLAEIEHRLQQRTGDPSPVEPESCWVYPISQDVTVQVRGGLSPWRARRIKSAIARLAAELALENDQRENGEEK